MRIALSPSSGTVVLQPRTGGVTRRRSDERHTPHLKADRARERAGMREKEHDRGSRSGDLLAAIQRSAAGLETIMWPASGSAYAKSTGSDRAEPVQTPCCSDSGVASMRNSAARRSPPPTEG